jgi:hypothetical protein
VAHTSEPFFNVDETRHVMTGVYVRDLLHDMPVSQLKEHAVGYFLQYPALGILVWPPCFYVIEGTVMCALGTSFTVARSLVAAFGVIGLGYYLALVRRHRSSRDSLLAALLLGLCPIVFVFCRHVMLEIPMMAFILAAVFHGDRYLEEHRRPDLWLASILAAAAALTRFDAIVLIPMFAILVMVRGGLVLIRRAEVILAVFLALLLTLPYYAMTFYYYWQGIQSAAIQGASRSGNGLWRFASLAFYPAAVPEQVGWFLTIPGVIGLARAMFLPEHRRRSWTFLALVTATYLTFTPLAERQSRHALAWVPAIVVFAVDGLDALAGMVTRSRLWPVLATVVLMGTIWSSLRVPSQFVLGYEDAARYVVANSPEDPVILFDGHLNGDFVYQVRRADPSRKCTVLRADHILYRSLSETEPIYEDYSEGEPAMLARTDEFSPDYLVVENPSALRDLPPSQRLRSLLEAQPNRFRHERSIPVASNIPAFRGVVLEIYRNQAESGRQRRPLSVRIPSLGRSLHSDLRVTPQEAIAPAGSPREGTPLK